jgi:hypothetical protein
MASLAFDDFGCGLPRHAEGLPSPSIDGNLFAEC